MEGLKNLKVLLGLLLDKLECYEPVTIVVPETYMIIPEAFTHSVGDFTISWTVRHDILASEMTVHLVPSPHRTKVEVLDDEPILIEVQE